MEKFHKFKFHVPGEGQYNMAALKGCFQDQMPEDFFSDGARDTVQISSIVSIYSLPQC